MLSHVRLPEGFALNLGLKDYASRRYLKEALIGRRGDGDEQIHPGRRTYDGTYTELTLHWQGIEVLVQSVAVGEDLRDLIVLATPASTHRKPPLLVVEPGVLWNQPGHVIREGEALLALCAEKTFVAYGTRLSVSDPYIAAQTPYLAMPLDGPVGLSTGRRRSVEEIQAILARHRADHETYVEGFEELSEVYAAVQTCLAWDTVYEPEGRRVISPVSRIWNVHWGGFVLFDWDTYFAAYLAALDNKALAYANAVEITRERTERGFIPNFGTVADIKSRDRSQPPVGSLVVRELYRRFGDQWLLEEVFEDLLNWNRWWPEARACSGLAGGDPVHGDLLCWGSDPYTPRADAHFELHGVRDRLGAALESGLNNSPMYDDVPFDPQTNLMQLADAGLNGMYVLDCEALGDIAAVLGEHAVAAEVRERAAAFRAALAGLWDAERGLFFNRRTDTGEFSRRISPTNFYPLLGRAATQEQAERMIAEHFYNPGEFWGMWVLPSIVRDDPAYLDQTYWRAASGPR